MRLPQKKGQDNRWELDSKIVVPHSDHRLHYSPNHDKLYTYPLQKVDVLSYFGTQIRDDLTQMDCWGIQWVMCINGKSHQVRFTCVYMYICSVYRYLQYILPIACMYLYIFIYIHIFSHLLISCITIFIFQDISDVQWSIFGISNTALFCIGLLLSTQEATCISGIFRDPPQ